MKTAEDLELVLGKLDDADEYDHKAWGGYPKEAFDMDSKALIACDGSGNGAVIETGGPAVPLYAEGLCGSLTLEDYGLDNAPEGLSIWEGRYVSIRGEDTPNGYGETDIFLEGDFRELNAEERKSLAAGDPLFDESDWGVGEPEIPTKASILAELRRQIIGRLCKGRMGCDAGSPTRQTGPCAGCYDLLDLADEMGCDPIEGDWRS